MIYSTKRKIWNLLLDFKTCLNCRKNHGKIYAIDEIVYPAPPLHPNCRCIIERLMSVAAGDATNEGVSGADWYLKFYGRLPDYYATKERAEALGYISY